ncbi:MAG: hypothetical protein JW881_06810 [Spirochaetales bacterium]|nr:hypothetical protein [Spirochaetales bacterium]
MDEKYEPLIIDGTLFVSHYQNKGLRDIIHGLSWVTECFGILDQIKRNPANGDYKKRLLDVIIPELKKEPVGEKGRLCLEEIARYVETHSILNRLDEKTDFLLKDLSTGYRYLLKRFVSQ